MNSPSEFHSARRALATHHQRVTCAARKLLSRGVRPGRVRAVLGIGVRCAAALGRG